jgi:phosphoglycolate phosphatase
MTLPIPTTILFDWDNTLVDTWPAIHESLNMTMRYMQHPEWSLEKVKRDVKKSMRDAFPEMFGDRWEEASQHYQQSYRSIHLTNLHALPGATEMLAAAYPHILLGVVSNKRGASLRIEVPHVGWEDYFAVLVGAGDAARDKPYADPALMALDKMGVAPSPNVWFVGDTTVDLDCANAAGLTPILYGDVVTDAGMYEGSTFAAHVRDLDKLTALILNHLN